MRVSIEAMGERTFYRVPVRLRARAVVRPERATVEMRVPGPLPSWRALARQRACSSGVDRSPGRRRALPVGAPGTGRPALPDSLSLTRGAG